MLYSTYQTQTAVWTERIIRLVQRIEIDQMSSTAHPTGYVKIESNWFTGGRFQANE